MRYRIFLFIKKLWGNILNLQYELNFLILLFYKDQRLCFHGNSACHSPGSIGDFSVWRQDQFRVEPFGHLCGKITGRSADSDNGQPAGYGHRDQGIGLHQCLFKKELSPVITDGIRKRSLAVVAGQKNNHLPCHGPDNLIQNIFGKGIRIPVVHLPGSCNSNLGSFGVP